MSELRFYKHNRRAFLKTALQAGATTSLAPAARAFAATASKTFDPAPHAPFGQNVQLNVRDFGAMGDGTTLDTDALQRTLDRVNVLGGGEALIPAGNYLTGSLSLRSNVTLRLEAGTTLLGSPALAHYRVAEVRWEGKWIPGYTALIHALDAQNIRIIGPGRIEGNIAVAGRPTQDNPLRRPALIEFIGCQDIHLEGFSTLYAHMWSIHPTCCDRLVFRNLNVRSTQTNGDGIDLDSCRHVLIDTCDIASGDDCISLKSGRGEEAYQMARPTEDIRIVNCTLEGRGFACIGIGSETSGGIRNVLITDCHVTSVYKFAVYIKSRVGRGAFIEDITFRNLDASKMRQGFLKISQTSAGIQDTDPVPGLDGLPLFRNFRFQNIHVQDAPILIEANELSPEKPLDGFIFENVTGSCSKAITMANIHNATLRNVTVTGYTGALLHAANVSGKHLPHSDPVPPPKPPVLVPSPPVLYRLH